MHDPGHYRDLSHDHDPAPFDNDPRHYNDGTASTDDNHDPSWVIKSD